MRMMRLAVAVPAAVGLAAGVTGTASAAIPPPSGLTGVVDNFIDDPDEGFPCLDVQGGSHSAGAFVQVFKCNGTPAQQWRFELTRFGTYEILNADNLCLSPDPKTGPVPMSFVRQEPCGPPGGGQTWILQGFDNPGDSFELVNAESNGQLCLSRRLGGSTDEITEQACNHVELQRATWHF
ncbi:RICIN domain-containing protein [Kutzneria buriramensis]|uniref:Ricin-type beta-trefoil lectin protein n=1 Tax=Kutzneria buriramensis TaxID=1045776 RepID=A0A3E0H7D1_9PSEU|nr:RICIN domain-containing protein [Kutzneria buriramensis]REH39342.1 ricin-type beta-trefoil lectin protein [Kutzneria buriramensis]